MPDNIRGIFSLELDGQNRDLKCNFSVVEHLERNIFQRPAIQVLADATNGIYLTHEIVDTIIAGLKANGDTRFTRDQIGEMVISRGAVEFADFYMRFLTYIISGKEDPEIDESPDLEEDPAKKKPA